MCVFMSTSDGQVVEFPMTSNEKSTFSFWIWGPTISPIAGLTSAPSSFGVRWVWCGGGGVGCGGGVGVDVENPITPLKNKYNILNTEIGHANV